MAATQDNMTKITGYAEERNIFHLSSLRRDDSREAVGPSYNHPGGRLLLSLGGVSTLFL